jgi:hypothetical protein
VLCRETEAPARMAPSANSGAAATSSRATADSAAKWILRAEETSASVMNRRVIAR